MNKRIFIFGIGKFRKIFLLKIKVKFSFELSSKQICDQEKTKNKTFRDLWIYQLSYHLIFCYIEYNRFVIMSQVTTFDNIPYRNFFFNHIHLQIDSFNIFPMQCFSFLFLVLILHLSAVSRLYHVTAWWLQIFS